MAKDDKLAKEVDLYRGKSAPKVGSNGSYGSTAKSKLLSLIAIYGPAVAEYIYSKLTDATGKTVASPEDVENTVNNAAIYREFATAAAEKGVPPTETIPEAMVASNAGIAKIIQSLARTAEQATLAKMKVMDKTDDAFQAGINVPDEVVIDVLTLITLGEAAIRHFGSIAEAKKVQLVLANFKSGDWDDLEALAPKIPGLR